MKRWLFLVSILVTAVLCGQSVEDTTEYYPPEFHPPDIVYWKINGKVITFNDAYTRWVLTHGTTQDTLVRRLKDVIDQKGDAGYDELTYKTDLLEVKEIHMYTSPYSALIQTTIVNRSASEIEVLARLVGELNTSNPENTIYEMDYVKAVDEKIQMVSYFGVLGFPSVFEPGEWNEFYSRLVHSITLAPEESRSLVVYESILPVDANWDVEYENIKKIDFNSLLARRKERSKKK